MPPQGIISFGGSKPKQSAIPPQFVQLKNQFDNITRRLRVLEERYANMRKNMQVIEQNMLRETKQVSDETKLVTSEIDELKRTIRDMQEQSRLIIRDLKDSAKKEDVAVLQKYINTWEPINFVTQKEVEKIVDRAIEKKLAEK